MLPHSPTSVRPVRTRLTPAARRALIGRLFTTQPTVAIAELAQTLHVSEMTVRRDLSALEESSPIQRTRGGAMLAQRMVLDFDYGARRDLNRAAKCAIAEAARKLIRPGHRLILGAGTTTLELAALLKDATNLTVITPNLAVAVELQYSRGVKVITLGGVVRQGAPDLTGPATEHCLSLFTADIAFQGAEAIGDNGAIYAPDAAAARIEHLIRRLATCRCVLADRTKIGRTGAADAGTLRDVDVLVTERGLPAPTLHRFAALSATVITVSV